MQITINRPEKHNAFTPRTVQEMAWCFADARDDIKVGVVILTGQGERAFCSGGDQHVRGEGGYVGGDGIPRLNVLDLQTQIRKLPKPVICMVAGYAVGGGHILHMVCDITVWYLVLVVHSCVLQSGDLFFRTRVMLPMTRYCSFCTHSAALPCRFLQTMVCSDRQVRKLDLSMRDMVVLRWCALLGKRRPGRCGSLPACTLLRRRWRWDSSTRHGSSALTVLYAYAYPTDEVVGCTAGCAPGRAGGRDIAVVS